MNVLTILAFALQSLKRAPVRSSLTALGVIVGVSAVVATTSIGNGARIKIEETLAKPESRTIYLGAMLPPGNQRFDAKLAPKDNLKTTDYYAIRGEVTNVSAISPRVYLAGAQARANGRSVEIVIEGVDVGGFTTVPRTLLDGELFSSTDVAHASSVCVISESLARALYPDGQRVRRIARVNDTHCTVLGVVDDVPSANPMFSSTDLHVYMPFTSLLRRLDPVAHMVVSVQAKRIEDIGSLQQEIGDVMERRRSGRKATFFTSTAFDSIKAYADGSLTVARLLAAVGAISLVVGGIGIMNIMLVSVTERTREIGVRMAIGTRCKHILNQFLMEAIALSLLGGSIGIAVGWAASLFITRLNGWPTAITPSSILSAFVCSVIVGVFFGYHPASRASRLSPVSALRAEG